jgi:hypothetical protein
MNYKVQEQSYFVPYGDFADVIFRGGSYGISTGYTDHAGAVKDGDNAKGTPGRYVEYIASKDDNGRDKAKRFKFDQSLGRFATRQSDTDIYGKRQYDFLKNHPECEGSPNGNYVGEGNKKVQTGITFREADALKDSSAIVKIDKQRIKAESSAVELDDETMTEIANLIGYFGEADDLMRTKVMDFAKRKPAEYLDALNADDRGVRAIIRKGLKENVFFTVGEMIKWDKTTLGNNENDAVAFLRKEKEVLTAIQEKLNMIGIDLKKKK